MGWWGNYIGHNATMQDIRNYIEKDTQMTVKSVKFGYAICVVDEQAIEKYEHWTKNFKDKSPLNYILIALWRYSKGEIMVKQVGEDGGPCERDIPLKYINAPCEIMDDCKYSIEWRENVRQFHAKRKAKRKLTNSFETGNKFFVYGEEYSFIRKKNSNYIIGRNLENDRIYRIRPMQVETERIPLPEGVSLRR